MVFGMSRAGMSSAPATHRSQSSAADATGVKEWFWRGNALKDAKSASTLSSSHRERLRRARLAAEFAGRMIDPAEPWYDGSALPLAISLYREAAYWVLLAHRDAAESATLRELLTNDNYPTGDLTAAEVTLVKETLGEKTFVQTADEASDALRREAVACRTFVQGLIRTELAAERKVTSVLLQRMLRVGIVVVGVAVALMAINAAVQSAIRGPDLAAGKPWRASSKAYDCKPADMECGGAHTGIFFHTLEQDNPWVEIDLGKPTKFARVEVVNRDDCCLERAAPLVIETSNDGQEYREVARTTEAFDTWSATFQAVTARYVRARVDRKSFLHLVRLGVRKR
jgi:hypothetical protein